MVCCRARLLGGDEGVVVHGKVGRRSGEDMTFQLALDLGRAEEGVGNQLTTFRELLDYTKSDLATKSVTERSYLITLLSDMTDLIIQLMHTSSLIRMQLTC